MNEPNTGDFWRVPHMAMAQQPLHSTEGTVLKGHQNKSEINCNEGINARNVSKLHK